MHREREEGKNYTPFEVASACLGAEITHFPTLRKRQMFHNFLCELNAYNTVELSSVSNIIVTFLAVSAQYLFFNTTLTTAFILLTLGTKDKFFNKFSIIFKAEL